MQEFKNSLKQIAGQLKGITLQLVNETSATPFNNLKAFGFAVLKEEQAGNEMKVSRVWTSNGAKDIDGFDQLVSLLKSTKVTGVQFRSFYQPKDQADYLRTFIGTNE